LAEVFLLNSGRPVLVVPDCDTRASLFRTIVVCWNGSREAARVTADALPFLKMATHVVVLTVGEVSAPSARQPGPAENAAFWLERHGIRALVQNAIPSEGDVGRTLLSQAAALGATLVVTGAFGHSRVHDRAPDGVTRTLLRSATMPLLMAH
jgi:nucleotide-binding universal stress UspA family protein